MKKKIKLVLNSWIRSSTLILFSFSVFTSSSLLKTKIEQYSSSQFYQSDLHKDPIFLHSKASLPPTVQNPLLNFMAFLLSFDGSVDFTVEVVFLSILSEKKNVVLYNVALEINRSLQLVSKMEDEKLQESKKWLHYLSTGAKGINELEALTLIGLQVLNAHKGFFHCNFIVPDHLSDQDGNWHVGAIATMIDDVGAAAVYSTLGLAKTVDITLSYYSRVKIREEVELVADIVGDMGKLICVVVKVTRKENGEMVALGKQWMASFSPKTKLSQVSSRL